MRASRLLFSCVFFAIAGCGRTPLHDTAATSGAGGSGGSTTSLMGSTNSVVSTAVNSATTSVEGTSVTDTSVNSSGETTSIGTAVSGTSVTSTSSFMSSTSSFMSSTSSFMSSVNSVSSTSSFMSSVNSVSSTSSFMSSVNSVSSTSSFMSSVNSSSATTTTGAVCGNRMIEPGEQCDDGNVIDGDGCSSKCLLPACGDGVLDPNEACDLGAQNADRPALQISQGAITTALPPIDHTGDASLFYNYFSASSHTGFEALGASRMFFYRDTSTGLLSLIVHHGIDFNTSNQHQPMSHVQMTFSALPSMTVVSLSDDSTNEFQKTNTTTAVGDWHFTDNSDGGVLSGFPFPGNWAIDVSPQLFQGISTWSARDATSTVANLDLSSDVTLRAFDSPSKCRTDCTVPRCGDGILDGGEICDDGNNVGGDGCSADCLTLQ